MAHMVEFVPVKTCKNCHKNNMLTFTCLYGGTKVTWKIYFILRAHAVANTCAHNNLYVRT